MEFPTAVGSMSDGTSNETQSNAIPTSVFEFCCEEYKNILEDTTTSAREKILIRKMFWLRIREKHGMFSYYKKMYKKVFSKVQRDIKADSNRQIRLLGYTPSKKKAKRLK